MSKSQRLSLLIAATTATIAATIASPGAFAQTPATVDAQAGAQAIPPGTVQIQPPKDPLVERREARKQAHDQYKATKSQAKQEYKSTAKDAKQEQKTEDKAADTAAREALASPATKAQ